MGEDMKNMFWFFGICIWGIYLGNVHGFLKGTIIWLISSCVAILLFIILQLSINNSLKKGVRINDLGKHH